jgi:hypothetical protein
MLLADFELHWMNKSYKDTAILYFEDGGKRHVGCLFAFAYSCFSFLS